VSGPQTPHPDPAGNGGVFSSEPAEFTLLSKDNREIVRITGAGEVVLHPDVPVDDAAFAFWQAIRKLARPSTPSGGGSAGGAPGAIAGDSGRAAIARSADEFQRAHDVLVGLIRDPELREVLGFEDLDSMVAAADVLCWALGHDHNTQFAKNLEAIEHDMHERGFQMYDSGRLQKR
jgi:hypothetical protein